MKSVVDHDHGERETQERLLHEENPFLLWKMALKTSKRSKTTRHGRHVEWDELERQQLPPEIAGQVLRLRFCCVIRVVHKVDVFEF